MWIWREHNRVLEYIILPKGLTMDPHKLADIFEWAALRDMQGVQQFLSFANFHQHFINAFFCLGALMTALWKSIWFVWSPKAQSTFDQLKRAFSTGPILIHPDPIKLLTGEANVSYFIIGTILLQQRGPCNQFQSYAFYLWKLTLAEGNYDIWDKLLLEIKAVLESGVTSWKEPSS